MVDITIRLRTRAEIRRNAKGRKSVVEGKPDRIADLLVEAAIEIETLRDHINFLYDDMEEELGETR